MTAKRAERDCEADAVLLDSYTPLPIPGKFSKVKKAAVGKDGQAFFVIFGGTAHFILREY